MITTLPKADYNGYTAIIASPSIGNVSQLCLDLVISSLKSSHIGMIWHEGILPMVGADPYVESSNKICSSNDVYCSDKNKLILFQLRAPVQAEHVDDYLNKLIDYFKSVNILNVIILTGVFGHQRDDEEIQRGPFRYITCHQGNSMFRSDFESFGWHRMKDNDPENNFSCPKLLGGGLTRMLFNKAVKSDLTCTALLLFCSEGDNTADALNLLNNLNTWLKFMPDNLNNVVYPPSWKYLFGNSVPRHIY